MSYGSHFFPLGAPSDTARYRGIDVLPDAPVTGHVPKDACVHENDIQDLANRMSKPHLMCDPPMSRYRPLMRILLALTCTTPACADVVRPQNPKAVVEGVIPGPGGQCSVEIKRSGLAKAPALVLNPSGKNVADDVTGASGALRRDSCSP